SSAPANAHTNSNSPALCGAVLDAGDESKSSVMEADSRRIDKQPQARIKRIANRHYNTESSPCVRAPFGLSSFSFHGPRRLRIRSQGISPSSSSVQLAGEGAGRG